MADTGIWKDHVLTAANSVLSIHTLARARQWIPDDADPTSETQSAPLAEAMRLGRHMALSSSGGYAGWSDTPLHFSDFWCQWKNPDGGDDVATIGTLVKDIGVLGEYDTDGVYTVSDDEHFFTDVDWVAGITGKYSFHIWKDRPKNYIWYNNHAYLEPSNGIALSRSNFAQRASWTADSSVGITTVGSVSASFWNAFTQPPLTHYFGTTSSHSTAHINVLGTGGGGPDS